MKNQDCSGKKGLFSSHPFDERKERKREGEREGNRRAEKGKNTSMVIYCTEKFCMAHKAFSQLMI